MLFFNKWPDVQHKTSKTIFSHSEQSWKTWYRSRRSQRFFKTGVLKIPQTSQENTCGGVSFYRGCRVEALQHCQKETPTEVFFCEVCEIFENMSFYRTPLAADSGDYQSHARFFTLNRQTFSSQRVTFLKQPIIYGFIDDKNKETLINKFVRLSFCELKRLKRILRIVVA